MIVKISKDKTKYSTRPSPPVPAADHKNKIMVGNDGKKYISLSDSNDIYKWKLYDEYIDLTQLKNFKINVNNSLLLVRRKFVCKLTEDKILIIFDNELVPEINGTEIKVNINNIKQNFYFDISNLKLCIIQFIYKNLYIKITFSLNKFDDEIIIERLSKIPQYDNYFYIDEIPHNKIHHLGEMVILNIHNIRRLKRNYRYVIIHGKHWNYDYDGSISLAVLDYNGYYYDTHEKKNMIDGIVYTIKNNKLVEFNASEFMNVSDNCKKDDCIFGTEIDTEFYPVHLIVQLKKRIKLHRLLTDIK